MMSMQQTLGRLGQALALLSSLLANATYAQTMVSSPISVDSHWSMAESPYVISGDVVVQGGALLSIEPGVTVYMASNSNLTVQAGSIQALGTAAATIKILSDKTRLGQIAMPGDWKQWAFNPGTVNTRLDHVEFAHGSGVAVKGSAPVFNYLNIKNQQGPAISVDLAASPSGEGNQASGNTVNGIVVPAGEINGNVKWALRGIPYVVTAGTVSVGASPTVSSITPNVLQQGDTATVSIAGNRLSGLASASFDQPGLTAQVLPGATTTQANLSVMVETTAILGTATLRMLVDAGEIQLPGAITIERPKPTLTGVAPSPLVVGQGAVDVTLTGRNFTEQSVAHVNGVAVTTQFLSNTQLRARVVAPDSAGTLSLSLRTPDPLNPGEVLTSNELLLPVAVAQLAITPTTASIVKGAVKMLQVKLPFTAPVGGIIISLISSVPTVATVPTTVTVLEGTSSVDFQLTATGVGSTTVTASRVGFGSGQSVVTVTPPPTLTVTPSSLILGAGRSAELTINSSQVAGDSGLTINLVNDAPSVASIPMLATIPAGGTSTIVSVSAVAIGTASITAQAADFVSGNASVIVRPVSLNMSSSALVAPGLTRSIPVVLSDPAPEGGLVVSLASDNPTIATAPDSITVLAGQTSANFTLTGVAAGTTAINATAIGYQSATLPVTVQAVTIGIGNPVITSIALAVDIASPNYAITLSRPAPAGGVIVNLAIADPTKATVSPSSISIAEGQTSGGLVQFSVIGVAKGSTTLFASATGLNSSSIPVTVTSKPALSFSKSAITVGKGLNTYISEVSIQRKTDSSPYSPNQALTVTLSTSDATKASVPATVTIPAGSSGTSFYVTGVDLTSGTPVTIDAAAAGYTAPAIKLAVSVVTPTLNLSDVDTNRGLGDVRDNIRAYVTVPGAQYSGSQTAAANLPIDLSIVNANPAGIVDGFYSASTAGTAISQVLLRAGSTYSDYAYAGTPTAAGNYQVRASSATTSTVISSVVTVSAPGLQFSKTSVMVGKGLRSYINEVSVRRTVKGEFYSGPDALTVTLSTSDATKASVPVTVTIPAGSFETSFYVTGVDLTSGTPVTIDAAATGYAAPATKLAVNVVTPTLNLSDVDTNRGLGDVRDNIRAYVTVPGAQYSGSQVAAANLPIDLSIVNANPAGIVDGFYSASTAGTAISQVLLRAGSTYSDYAYAGTPTAAGNYQVRASSTTTSTVTSGVVTVSAPGLQFSKSSVMVGKGLRTYINEVYVRRTINGEAYSGPEALTVTLSTNDATKASVSATVTIPAGSSETSFYVTGVDLTSGTPATIDAAATGYVAPATKLAVNVVTPTLNLSDVDTNRGLGEVRENIRTYVTVPGAQYSGSQVAVANQAIDLSIVNANPAGIVDGFYSAQTAGTAISQVLLRAGNTYSDYAYVGTPTAAGNYQVRASSATTSTATSGVVTVSAPRLQFSKSSVTVGKGLRSNINEVSVSRTANGEAFNGIDPVTVNFACSSIVICRIPYSVTIPAGQSLANFQVEGVDFGNTTITANAIGYSVPQDLAVSTVIPKLNFSGPPTTKVGTQSSFTVNLTVTGASYSSSQVAVSPFTVNLTSSSPGVATVPPTATISTGAAGSGTLKLTGVAAGTTTLTASGTDLSSATTGVITISP